jgi:hypothetical protein
MIYLKMLLVAIPPAEPQRVENRDKEGSAQIAVESEPLVEFLSACMIELFWLFVFLVRVFGIVFFRCRCWLVFLGLRRG